LSGENSLFAGDYAWSILPAGLQSATLSSPHSARTTFTASADGEYVLQLVVSKNGIQSNPAQLTVNVDSNLAKASSAVTFADIKAILQATVGGVTPPQPATPYSACNATPTCLSCHNKYPLPAVPGLGPMVFENYDRDGDADAGGALDAVDEAWFYAQLRGKINLRSVTQSSILRKPSGHHHAWPCAITANKFDTSTGNWADRANYDAVLNWIVNGAPYQ
jgi:hypothetical protein